ncbi:MAG: hypothetical protein MJE66_20290 [Proteobacteria bacterium]|nr:hypothetical protein [Pseudomonadota bacterium]
MSRVGIAIACIAVLAGCSYVSASLGYLLGGPQYSSRFVPADAVHTVAVLRALRRGDSELAVSLLETHLDTQIIVHSMFSPRLAWWLDPVSSLLSGHDLDPHAETAAVLMRKVAAYRAQHPSAAAGEIHDLVHGHLAAFQSSPPGDPEGPAAERSEQ